MKKLLTIAIKAAVEAGIEIMKVYAEDFKVELKTDNSPLTIADQNANSVINTYLLKTGIPIISEENKQTDFMQRKSWEMCWMVDPLDGTKEFIKRNGEFTVNIALIHKNKPVLGVIYVPVTQTLYYGLVQVQKSYKIVLQQHQFSEETLLDKASEIHPQKMGEIVKVVGSRSHNSPETNAFIESFKKAGKTVEIVAKGSSLKFCLLAEGKAHVYPRFAPTMEWDTAAGHAICNAVGLKVMQATGKDELQYNKENLLNPFFKVL